MEDEKKRKFMKGLWVSAIVLAIIVGFLVWVENGYAPCDWYSFSANTTEARLVMERCI